MSTSKRVTSKNARVVILILAAAIVPAYFSISRLTCPGEGGQGGSSPIGQAAHALPTVPKSTQDAATSADTGVCTLSDYLIGAWERSDVIQVWPGYDFCQIDARQDCRAYATNADYIYSKWVPHQRRCALRNFSAAQVKRCFAGHKVVFFGDSLARNQQQSMQCMLMEQPEPPRPFIGGFKLNYDSYFQETNTLVRLQNSLFIRPEDVAKVQNDSIVIVGTGPHWSPWKWGFNTTHRTGWSEIPGGESAARALIESAIRESIRALQQLPASVRVIWRTPDLSHSSAPQSDDPWFKKCVPFPPTWDPWQKQLPSYADNHLQWIYDAILKHASGTRIELMDVMGISGLRPDGHPSAHLNRTRDGIPVHDCQHWCLPGVPDTWNEILINYLCQGVP